MNGQNISKTNSQSKEIISRINQKIDSLGQILSPIIVSKNNPEVVKEIQRGSVSDLNNIEERITNLLDSIVI